MWNYGLRSGRVVYGSFRYHLLYWDCRRRIPGAYQCGYPKDCPGRIKGKDLCLQGHLCECRYGDACIAHRQINDLYFSQGIDVVFGCGNFSYRYFCGIKKYQTQYHRATTKEPLSFPNSQGKEEGLLITPL